MPKKEIIIAVSVIDYWIDRKQKKAYCMYKVTHQNDEPKKSNIRIAESDYNGK